MLLLLLLATMVSTMVKGGLWWAEAGVWLV